MRVWSLVLLMACVGTPVPEGPSPGWEAAGAVPSPVSAAAAWDGVVWSASEGDVVQWTAADGAVEWASLGADVRWLAPLSGGGALAWLQGIGAVRLSGAMEPPVAVDWPVSGLVSGINPVAEVVPTGWDLDGDTLWISAAGGLFTTRDGVSITPVVVPATAGLNPLFTSVSARDGRVVATAFGPTGLVPETFAGLFETTVFTSEDGGASWSGDAAYRWPAAATADGWLATMSDGVLRRDGADWVAETGGPTDATSIHEGDGLLTVGSASSGLWWRGAGGAWARAGDGAVVALDAGAGDAAVLSDGTVLTPVEDVDGDALPAGGATVYVALSMHTNFYHSYRGDRPTEDGWGKDARVIRTTLDWLDARPAVRCDWDIDTYYSLDGFMTEPDAADVRARILARVKAGTDGARLMSWNNGAMLHHDRPAFDAAIARAAESYDAAFGAGAWDPGVQPQECMFTAHHTGWYADAGISWITLFHSATPFTALNPGRDLPAGAATNPVRMTHEGDALTLVPVYHHGDVIDHGGLRGWVRQLHQVHGDDQLLVIHFDADAESWEGFGAELDALDGLDFVRFTTIQDYLDAHVPEVEVQAPLDLADGTGNGLQSWAEKFVNHEVATDLCGGVDLVAAASRLAPGVTVVSEAADAAFEARLLALSTTHFGLAAPALHPEREVAARARAAAVREAGEDALAAAVEDAGLTPAAGQVTLVPGAAAPGLTRVVVEGPAGGRAVVGVDAGGAGGDGVGTQLLDGVSPAGGVAFLVDTAAGAARVRFDSLPVEAGLGTAPEVAYSPAGLCGSTPVAPTRTPRDAYRFGGGASAIDDIAFEGCLTGATGRVIATSFDALEDVVFYDVTLDLTAVDPEADVRGLLPLQLPCVATELSWRTFAGTVASRAVRPRQPSWNPTAHDGWVRVTCEDADDSVAIAHLVASRTSLGPLVLRQLGEEAWVAPLGTWYAPPPWLDPRFTGGNGLGTLSVPIIGSQFRPAAGDWIGAVHTFRLAVAAPSVSDGLLDRLAHPPVVARP